MNNTMTRQYRIGFITTSDTELLELFKAWVAVSAAFAILMLRKIAVLGLIQTFQTFFIAAIAVGTGFLLHELGHKVVAQHYGCIAEFRSDNKMLLLAIITSFLGFLFAAPGAVMIYGRIDKKQNGIISATGPAMNILVAAVFLLLSLQFSNPLFSYGYTINSWLAVFNMLPFSIIDGAKVLRWNKVAYGIIMGIAILLMLAKRISAL